MQEINWNNFKAKFNREEQKSFEDLCYSMFCREFNQNTGIFRYKNQAGIETEPIQHDNERIGFQAKFYETKISDNKNDIKDSITKAKRKNPELDKILFYINREFSESSKKDQKEPQYKIEIENHAKSEGVAIEWRVPSHFEMQLSQRKNQDLAQHFFGFGKSVIDFILELNQHTESILTPIQSEIRFNGSKIKIDRSKEIDQLKKVLNQSSSAIVSGEAGIGKTAVIKDFYQNTKDAMPFFVFKATEFNVPNINDLFKRYGNFTFADFIREHQGIDSKYIIIDSAEKLSDIENQDIFHEFLSALLNNSWRIIFTTRYGYLKDLEFQFIEVYNLSFHPINIEKLDIAKLTSLSNEYGFSLPDSEKLLELLQIPFYLNEYLRNYPNIDNNISFSGFKNIIWSKQISKSSYRKDNTHIKREKCFLEIAKRRANSGHFFVTVGNCEDRILQILESDEIIKYDSNAGGYFITHDIYEEWALDRIIEREYHNPRNNESFFDAIGSSLPIRRAFRIWLSEKLLSDSSSVRNLVENTIVCEQIESFWKDEILVSVLLSDYSSAFFKIFENDLLEDNRELLIRMVFLLRIACKEIDQEWLNLLGLQGASGITLKTLFTRPRGSGWNRVIDFICRHKEELGLDNMNIILPLLDDWNSKIKEGETTKQASQIALYYYEEITKNGGFGYNFRDERKEQLIRVILQGASEIKDELTTIFEEVIREKQTNHTAKYYELIQTVLTSITDSFEVVKNLPEHVLALADLFWFQVPEPEIGYFGYSGIGVEKDFCISARHSEYFPASAFQTPIYQLLRISPKESLDFILLFTNKTVQCYAKSGLDGPVKEVEVFIDENLVVKQYISNRLWNMYRGSQEITPDLLGSIHMALEKWLLEIGKSASKQDLESICAYLIKNSKSASITAVVASLVLAYPSKLFNTALILFRTKEFFLFDTNRFLLDRTSKSNYSIGYGVGDYRHKIHQDERIKTCDDEHRKWALENLALNYQVFIAEEDQGEAQKRQKRIWDIFDKYYQELPEKSDETESDKTWRLYLARMDRRKMNPEVEKREGQVLITFNPKMEPELKKFSEESLQKSSDAMRYTPLQLWSYYRFKREEGKYEQYQQYEDNPQLVIKETREITKGLKKESGDFFLFNHSIPAYTCSILVRDYFDRLDKEEKEFCRGIIKGFASIPLQGYYQYQISDGAEPAIIILPKLTEYFPEDVSDIKRLLILLLLNPWEQISAFAAHSIFKNLWEVSSEDAHSIFLGYLLLAPKYDELADKIRKKNYKKGIYEISGSQVLRSLIKQYKRELENIISSKISYDALNGLDKLDLGILQTAFELIPLRTNNEDHKKYVTTIFPVFSKKIFIDDDRIDYSLKRRFFERFAYFVLTSTKDEIETYLEPLIESFSHLRNDFADFFQSFIFAEDKLEQYENFWVVWNSFYGKIVELCKTNSSYHYTKGVIYNYLLAWPYWRKDAKEWHTLKEREKLFFKKVAKDIGYHPAVLYSLSKVLNDIGSNFLKDGILWISGILQEDNDLLSAELEVNTIYYIETLVRRYIFTNRRKVKTTSRIRDEVLAILNFLIERGSVTGYLLREDVL